MEYLETMYAINRDIFFNFLRKVELFYHSKINIKMYEYKNRYK